MAYARGARGAVSDSRNGRGQPSEDEQLHRAIRDQVQRRLLAELDPSVDSGNPEEVRRTLERLFVEALAQQDVMLSRNERTDLFEQIVAQTVGFGPIEPLLHDETITEIMINGPDLVFIERNGIVEETDIHFRDNADVQQVIQRIVAPLGRRVDETSPMVDARLPDGSRVNVIIPPLSLIGPIVTIRKFPASALGVEDLLFRESISRPMIDFLEVCVKSRLNIVVSGGTSSGKTTFLNILSSFLGEKERIITIEDAAELQLQQRHVIPLESRPPNIEGRGEIPIRQLVINALRMRPDRIVVGEVRGGEALDMLQAMNTGHEGSLATAHSNSPRDTLSRVETMVLMAGMDLPLRAIREQIASAFDVIVHVERLSDGRRKVTHITEVQGMESETIVMQDIFHYRKQGMQNGRVQGYFTATGVRPKFMEIIESRGYDLLPNTFIPTPVPALTGEDGRSALWTR